jgi:hypothetical protein
VGENPMGIEPAQLCRCGHSWSAHERGGRCIAARCLCREWGDLADADDLEDYTWDD